MKNRVEHRHAFAALLLSLAAGAAQAAPTYTAQMLALPDGMAGSRAWGLSNGVVVGEVRGASAADGPRAVAWAANGTPTLLPGAGAFESAALAISGSTIVGYRATVPTSTEFDALRWSGPADGTPAALGPVADGGARSNAAAGSWVAGITDQGAFVYNAVSGTFASVGGAGSVAYGVRADGVAVGQGTDFAPAVFGGPQAGALDLLSSHGGLETGTAFAILGEQVIGSYDDPDSFAQKAFLTVLGSGATSTLFDGSAFGLNAAGEVVGADFDAGLAMLFSGGVAYDLNTLVTGGLSGFTLTQARAIDDQGRIVAFGSDLDGNERAFLLSLGTGGGGDDGGGGGGGGGGQTVPLPGTLALAGLGLLVLRRARRRR